MSVFIDTGIFVAFHNTRDTNHEGAKELVERALSGEFGLLYSSDYVFDESVTVALVRTGRPPVAVDVGRMILGELERIPPFLLMLKVDENTFKGSWKLFLKHAERGLSFTDCTSIALMKSRGIENIMSFDDHFDGIVPRIY